MSAPRQRPDRAASWRAQSPGLAAFLAVPLLFWLAAWIGSLLTLTPEAVSLLWPPNAVLLGAIVLYAGRGWAGFAALTLVAELAADLPHGIEPRAALVFGLANVLEVSVAWLLLQRWGFDPRFERLEDVGRFLLAGPGIGALTGAAVGTTFLGLVEGLTSSWLDAVLLWWFGDGLGLLVFFPLVVTFWMPSQPPAPSVRPGLAVDVVMAILGAATLVVVASVEGGALYGVHSRPVLLLPFTLYAAVRLPFRWVCLLVASVALLFVGRTVAGHPLYEGSGPLTSVVWTQEFVLVHSLVAQGVSALLASVRRHEELLGVANVELERRAAALEQGNAELRRVAFVAAHDLQTPLRSISGFVQLLQAEFAGRLGPVADDWIRRTTENTRRLEALLRDLGALAALDADTTPFRPVDMAALHDDVVRGLERAIEESGAAISRGELPVVRGNPDQLARLLKELLVNALKFRGEAPPRVHVAARREPGQWVFSVHDNGVGIPPEEHARVFELFHRLPSARDTPGTGFGLAMCARVVHRHGGRIWLAGAPGLGSIFFFTLPRAEDA